MLQKGISRKGKNQIMAQPTAGRPPKPNELKRVMGNPGGRPLPDLNVITHLPMAREIPEPPESLKHSGLDLWNRAWGVAITWLSPVSDIEAIKNSCHLADANEAARDRYMISTEPADAKAYVAINKAYTDSLTSLGFDPVSRSRLGVAEVRAATSIDRLLEKRERRAKIVFDEDTTQGETIDNEANSN
jgi:phage terminase small subunit